MGPIVKHAPRPIGADWFRSGALAVPLDYDCYWSGAALCLADRFYVDDLEQYRGYQAQGEFFQDGPAVSGDPPGILAGTVSGRRRDDERIVSMNMGISAEDLATASRLYDRALAEGVGRWLPLYD